jgi:hypothetical protein
MIIKSIKREFKRFVRRLRYGRYGAFEPAEVPQEMFGMRVIFGKFGVGKGVTNTIIALEEMLDDDNYDNACASIKSLEEKGNRTFNYPPERHVVFSNYKATIDGMQTYDFDPELFMLPNDELNYDAFPPYSRFHIEEAHSGGFSAYKFQQFPEQALMAFARIRHIHVVLTFDLQFLENLNTNMRRYSFEYITPTELKKEYDCLNRLIKVSTTCAVFHDYERALKYEATQNKAFVTETREYTFDGNIFEHYDSYSKEAEFYNFGKEKNFEYRRAQ